MSLTSRLDDRSSPVYQFLYKHFPNVGEPLQETRGALRDAATIKPSNRVPYGTLGTALDYRVRYYFAVTPMEQLFASKGADRLDQFGAAPHVVEAYYDRFIPSLDGLLAKVRPAQRKLEREDEDSLLRHCVVLALFEEIYRSEQARQHSPLMKLESTRLNDLLGVAQPHWVDDLRAMSLLFHERFADQLSRPATLNPTFEGSTDMGGADADLILDGRLVEIKAAVDPGRKADKFRQWLYQMLGYVLLDYSDQYRITGMGFYFARQGVLVDWALPAVIDTLAGGQAPSLRDLRSQFRRVTKRRF